MTIGRKNWLSLMGEAILHKEGNKIKIQKAIKERKSRE
jgi:hypothetical protein